VKPRTSSINPYFKKTINITRQNAPDWWESLPNPLKLRFPLAAGIFREAPNQNKQAKEVD
jgi:hypothetical protein